MNDHDNNSASAEEYYQLSQRKRVLQLKLRAIENAFQILEVSTALAAESRSAASAVGEILGISEADSESHVMRMQMREFTPYNTIYIREQIDELDDKLQGTGGN